MVTVLDVVDNDEEEDMEDDGAGVFISDHSVGIILCVGSDVVGGDVVARSW